MAKKGNILMSMSIDERTYMRKVVGLLEGRISASSLPDRKREALELYREKVNKACSPCVEALAKAESEKMAAKMQPRKAVEKHEAN